MAASKATTTSDIKAEEPKGSDVKYVKVTSPTGAATSVPEEIVDALLESGYKKSK